MVLKSWREVVGVIVCGAFGVIMAVVVVFVMTVRHCRCSRLASSLYQGRYIVVDAVERSDDGDDRRRMWGPESAILAPAYVAWMSSFVLLRCFQGICRCPCNNKDCQTAQSGSWERCVWRHSIDCAHARAMQCLPSSLQNSYLLPHGYL